MLKLRMLLCIMISILCDNVKTLAAHLYSPQKLVLQQPRNLKETQVLDGSNPSSIVQQKLVPQPVSKVGGAWSTPNPRSLVSPHTTNMQMGITTIWSLLFLMFHSSSHIYKGCNLKEVEINH
ncbi:hypothetical protein L6452_04804 [Arctium lappa]|uniref:Uncharacterized protein n=1 Tax=Arctium lappa TaxID=4217 RepID=A0ACB9EEZ7_ARCLA|nr:hypothetical protein L6452_04804 [Arctium lappa]